MARLTPSNVAFVDATDESVTTYSELWERVKRTCLELGDTNARKVIAILPNSRSAAVLYLACMVSGVDIYIIGDSFAKEELRRACLVFSPDLIVTTGHKVEGHELTASDKGKQMSVENLVGSHPRDSVPTKKISIQFSYGRQIVATSGSTGEPKMLALGGDALWSAAQVFSEIYGLTAQNTFWNYLPMSYLGGTFNLLLIPLASGGKVLIENSFGASILTRFFSTIDRFEVNTLWFVPTILRGLRRLIGSQSTQLPSSTQLLAFIGTAPSSHDERQWLEGVLGCSVYENYGLSETTFVLYEPIRSSGASESGGMQVFPGVEIEFATRGNTLKVRTPYLIEGYFTGPGNFEAIEPKSWFDTQDIVSLSPRGFSVTARKREIIKKGGLLVNLAEVEKLARDFVGWGDVAVVAVDDEFYGENYIVFFESRGVARDENLLIAHLAENFSKSKMPRDVRAVRKVFKTRSGKVDKTKTFVEASRTDHRIAGTDGR